MVVIGIDPGGAHTGMVARAAAGLVAHVTTGALSPARVDVVAARVTVDRGRGEGLDGYLRRVLEALLREVVQHLPSLDDLLVAIEDVKEPNPHLRLTNSRGLLDTAAVLGAVACITFAPVVLVAPGGHGSGPLSAYPPELRPQRGDGRGKDALRHERSAWDVAGAGLAQWRTGGSVAWASDTEPEPEGGRGK